MLFSLQLRQCGDLVQQKNYKQALSLLKTLHSCCQSGDGRDDTKNKGSELMEIYALRLMIAIKTKDTPKLKELYEKTRRLNCPLKNPVSQCILRECWGKMFGDQGQWTRAYMEFWSAFLAYQEIYDSQGAKRCLKYLLMANMLAKGEQNPMAARELRVFANDPEITPILQLRQAYEQRDVEAFGKCLTAFYQTADEFIQAHMNSTVYEFQRLAALKILKSYKRIRITDLAAKLHQSLEDTEGVLMQLILDGHLAGKIDQVGGILDLSEGSGSGGIDADKYDSLNQLSALLKSQQDEMVQPTAGRAMGMTW
jgi:COP9 signalosome complex subunit 2